MKNITVVYNQKSGGGDQLAALKQAFADNDLLATFVPLADLKNLKETDIIVAAGGDGTVNAVAQIAIKKNVPLGVIPAGTLNHFAKDLDIPLNFPQAVGVLRAAQPKQVDVASVNDHIFLNNSSLGIYPQVVRQRDGRFGWLGKWPAAAISFISVITHLKRYQIEITIDDLPPILRVTPFVFVGNNSYGIDEFGLSNRKKLDEGLLCLYLIKSHRLLSLIRITWRSLVGRVDRENDLETFTAKKIVIKTTKSALPVALDGELLMMTMPFAYQIKPRLLQVIVPPQSH